MITARLEIKEAVPNAKCVSPTQDLTAETSLSFDDDTVEYKDLISPPSNCRPVSDFKFTSNVPPKSAHTVNQVIDKKTNTNLFYKKTSEVMAWLEAAAAGAYRMYIPNHVMPSYAVYNGKKFEGVASEAVPKFKSLAIDKLESIDLDIDYLGKTEREQYDKIQILENLDKTFSTTRKEIETREALLQLKLKPIKEERKQIKKQISELGNSNYFVIGEDGKPKINTVTEVARLKQLLKKNSAIKDKLMAEQIEIEGMQSQFHEDMYINYQINPIEFERYRIIKGIANGLTASYIFTEDDLHRNNFTKYGYRIDFDMSFWSLFHDFKDESILIKAANIRSPGPHITSVNSEDIIRFPNTEYFKPYFWPTSQTTSASISSATNILRSLKTVIGFQDNDYEKRDNHLFQQLEDHPVFKYHKYVNMVKCILTTRDICRQNAEKNIPKDIEYNFNGKKDYLINHFVDQHEARVKAFEDALLMIPEFHDFFKKHHKNISEDLLKDLKKQNINYSDNEKNELIVGLEVKQQANDSIFPEEVMKRKCETILSKIETQEKKWSDKISNSEKNYNDLTAQIKNKINSYSPDGLLVSVFGSWARSAPGEEKIVAEKILKMANSLPDFIEKQKQAFGSHTHLFAIKKVFDAIDTEIDTYNLKNTKSLPKPEYAALIKEFKLLKDQFKIALPSEMLVHSPDGMELKMPTSSRTMNTVTAA